VTVAIYRHPSEAPAERCVVSTVQGWFEVPCGPGAGGWRVRTPYVGTRSGLAPIAGSRAEDLRAAIDYPGWLDAPDR
jgi:hypothetical protein